MENSLALTDEQARAATVSPDSPLRLTDPASHREYVLLRAEVYERLRRLLDPDQPQNAYAAVDRAFAAGWNDPVMEEYDRYEEQRP